jgi:homoserine dehydrogenase
LDVGGGDAAHKLALLAAIAFGGPPRLDAVHVEGITGLHAQDFQHARRLGYAVKLLAVAEHLGEGALQLRVHPALLPRESWLAQVDGRMNGILVKGNAAGVTMYGGAGAGGSETASAVVADLVDLARALRGSGQGVSVPSLGFAGETLAPTFRPIEALQLRHYLRVPLARADAGAGVIEALARHGVCVKCGTQTRDSLVVLTDPVAEPQVAAAVHALWAVEGINGPVTRLRVESLA